MGCHCCDVEAHGACGWRALELTGSRSHNDGGTDTPRSPRKISCPHAILRHRAAISTQNHALAHVQRLKRRQRNGNFDKNALVIASPDPDGSFIGSGGATMNAMLHVTEHLSARAGATFVDSAVLIGKHVIIMHVDGESRRMPLFSSSAASFDGTAVE